MATTLAFGALVAPALAAPAVTHYEFFNCTGGSLTSFTAVKVLLPGAEGGTASSASAFHILGSNQIYTVYNFGFGQPKGIGVSGVATMWCSVTYAGNVIVQVGGQLSGAG